MSRSGYVDDECDHWAHIRWRGQVSSSIRGKRGQKMLRDTLAALDAMPKKELIADDLECPNGVCALGALGRSRGIDMSDLDPHDTERVGLVFDIADPLVREVVWMNDEGTYRDETPRQRYERMRSWIISNLHGDLPSGCRD